MIYLLLVVIILLLIYVAFFTPEKRRQREINSFKKIFNTPLPEPPKFNINDPRNNSHPEEIVRYKNGLSNRKFAVLLYNIEKNKN